jgi:hypothetical protein
MIPQVAQNLLVNGMSLSTKFIHEVKQRDSVVASAFYKPPESAY